LKKKREEFGNKDKNLENKGKYKKKKNIFLEKIKKLKKI
jgi:hypothetical protein